MKKSLTTLLYAVAILFVAFFFVPSSDASAAKGPLNGTYSCSSITASSNESLEKTVIFAAKGYMLNSNEVEGTVKGVSYNEKTNTLTLKNASVFNLFISDMGEDFKIKLSGDNTLYNIHCHYFLNTMCVTFTGDGSLTLGAYKSPGITLDAEKSAGTVSFEDSVNIKFEHNNDFISGVAVLNTTARNPIKIGKGLKCFGSVKQEAASYYDFGSSINKMGTYAEKDKKEYFLLKEYTPDYSGSYYDVYLGAKKVESELYFEDLMKKGYRISANPKGSQNYYLGSVSEFEISPKLKETISAPKASVKASGKSAKIKVQKTPDAEGYTVSYIRLYESAMTDEGILEATTKDFKKPGKKVQTLTVKDLAPGAYMATVTPYKTVKGEKVYGSESNAVYFNIK